MTSKKSSLKKSSSKTPTKKVSFNKHSEVAQFVRRGSIPEKDIKGLKLLDVDGVLDGKKLVKTKSSKILHDVNVDLESETEEKIPENPREKKYFYNIYKNIGLPYMFYLSWLKNFPESDMFEKELNMKKVSYTTQIKGYLNWLSNKYSYDIDNIKSNITEWEERNIDLFEFYRRLWGEYLSEDKIEPGGFRQYLTKKGLLSIPNSEYIEPWLFFEQVEIIYEYLDEYLSKYLDNDYVIKTSTSNIINKFKNWLLRTNNSKNFQFIVKDIKNELEFFIEKTKAFLKRKEIEKGHKEFRNFYNTFLESQKKKPIEDVYLKYITRK